MRSPARVLKKLYELYRLNPRRKELECEISKQLGKEVRLVAKPTKSRDRSSIYWAMNGRETMGIVRLSNPNFNALVTPAVDPNPRYLLPTKYRLAYEWDAYRQLHPAGLSPEPIWHGKDAAMSSHVDWPRVSVQLIADQSRYWPIMERVLPAIRKMHDLGVIHMDLNLGNILADQNSDSVMFIDFEYAAVAGLTRGQQKAFDYLHVIRNTTRRRRGGNMLRADTDRMAKLLDSCLDDETRNAELDFSPNTIDKIDEVPGLKDSLKKVFTKL